MKNEKTTPKGKDAKGKAKRAPNAPGELRESKEERQNANDAQGQETLTDKQRLFVFYYLQDFNATKAAKRAGYSEDTAKEIGYENLTKPYIRQAITKKLEEVEITTTRILGELAKIAYTDMAEYVEIDDVTGALRALGYGEMEPGASRAIRKVKEKRKILQPEGKSEDIILESTYEFELHDKLKALELLGRHCGMFNDKLKIQGDPEAPIQHNHTVDIKAMTPEQLKDFIRNETHSGK